MCLHMRENERDSGGVRRLNGPIVFAGFLPKTPSASYTHTHTHTNMQGKMHIHTNTHTQRQKNLKNSHQLLSFQQQPRRVTSAAQKQISEQVKTPHINATASRKGLKEHGLLKTCCSNKRVFTGKAQNCAPPAVCHLLENKLPPQFQC